MIISLVRHARAGRRAAWTGPDADRPLDPSGRDQADDIARTLRSRDIARVVSSPALRCRQTVGPLALLLGRPVELSEALAEGARVAGSLALLDELVGAGRDVVLCSHGDVIPETLEALDAAGVHFADPRRCRKGSIWDLHVEGGRIVRATYIDAP